eukprot:549605_1
MSVYLHEYLHYSHPTKPPLYYRLKYCPFLSFRNIIRLFKWYQSITQCLFIPSSIIWEVLLSNANGFVLLPLNFSFIWNSLNIDVIDPRVVRYPLFPLFASSEYLANRIEYNKFVYEMVNQPGLCRLGGVTDILQTMHHFGLYYASERLMIKFDVFPSDIRVNCHLSLQNYKIICESHTKYDDVYSKCMMYYVIWKVNDINMRHDYLYAYFRSTVCYLSKKSDTSIYFGYLFIFCKKYMKSLSRRNRYQFVNNSLGRTFIQKHIKFANHEAKLSNIDCFAIGKVYSVVDRNYEAATKYYFNAIMKSFDAIKDVKCCGNYVTAMSLFALSENCYLNKEYVMSIKVLNYAYKIGYGLMLHSFFESKYPIQKKQILKKLENMKCRNCNALARKSCAGCMKAFYCSKRCQKLQWKIKHNGKCDRSWRFIYGELKINLFNRLKGKQHFHHTMANCHDNF